MARIFAVANQKGGVGKTTTAVNLTAGLARMPKRVLLIDLDPQGNATMGSGIDKREQENTICEVLLRECPIDDAILRTEEQFDLIPGNMDLTAAEISMIQGDEATRGLHLRELLATVRDKYDFIVIDCPPSLSLLTVNALNAADSIIIPMQCEYYALEGISSLMDTVQALQQSSNPDLEIEGVLRTMFDVRSKLANAVSDELMAFFGDKVFRTIVPRNVRLAEAPSHGQSIVGYDKGSRGGIAYIALAGEVIRIQREREKQQRARKSAPVSTANADQGIEVADASMPVNDQENAA